MKFHKISHCPDCSGRIHPKWEWVEYRYANSFWQLVFQCAHCNRRWRLFWDFAPYKGNVFLHSIRRWNAYCNGTRRYIPRDHNAES